MIVQYWIYCSGRYGIPRQVLIGSWIGEQFEERIWELMVMLMEDWTDEGVQLRVDT